MPAPTPSNLADRAALVHRLALAEGFDLAGIAPARSAARPEYLQKWIADGQHGDMDYLADPQKLQQMLDPRHIVPEARSIICVADLYPSCHSSLIAHRSSSSPLGRIARYAWGNDYHSIIKKRLHHMADALREVFPQHTFRCGVDTAPILEREHAARAGLGFVGKHTLLIHPQRGSWFFLGVIITTLPLQTAAHAAGVSSTDEGDPADFFGRSFPGCGNCTRCIDACPTRAISAEGYTLDATRCVSYLTLEHKGEIAPDLQTRMADWIAGCDVCQEVCPFNRAADDPDGKYKARARGRETPLLDILNWTEDDRRRAFRGSALKRIKLDQIRRNALIAAGNLLAQRDDAELRSKITALANDPNESALVRLTARLVCARFKKYD